MKIETIKISDTIEMQLKDDNIIIIDNEFEQRVITLTYEELIDIKHKFLLSLIK